MLRHVKWIAAGLILFLPACASAPRAAGTDSTAVAEVRQAVRRYDEALRKADAVAAGQFWADEYVFVNPRGERLTRADRLANLRTGRTAFDSLAPVPQEEQFRAYGDVVVHTTLLTIGGRYSGQAQQGHYRALVLWVRRDGRWQQAVSYLTPVLGP